MTGLLVTALLGVAAGAESGSGPAGELAAPVRIEAAGKPIDTAVGHAAPFVGDYDGDRVPDLLVGQFGDGILWIYRNEGTAARPKLSAGVKFKDGTRTAACRRADASASVHSWWTSTATGTSMCFPAPGRASSSSSAASRTGRSARPR